MTIISDQSVKNMNVSPDETILTGASGSPNQFSFNNDGKMTLSNTENSRNVQLAEVQDRSILPSAFLMGGPAVAVVDDSVYQQLDKDLDPDLQSNFGSTYIGIDIADKEKLQKADSVFQDMNLDAKDNPAYGSQQAAKVGQKQGGGSICLLLISLDSPSCLPPDAPRWLRFLC